MMACDPQLHVDVIAGKCRLDGEKYHLPANGVNRNMEDGLHHRLQHRDTPPVGSLSYSKPAPMTPKLSSTTEEDLEEDDQFPDTFDNELSAEAQAHNISMFLSSSNSDSGGEEPITETVITDVYKDPLEFCMEGIEEMARKILRTGRLAIAGEPGDMSKIQPAMFNLQASEKEMAQILPQLMQVPLFCQGNDQLNITEDEDFSDLAMTIRNTDEALANGNIRVALPVDTAIYSLLRSHCAKGARQAEEVINTAMHGGITNLHLPTSLLSLSAMPPIFKFQSTRRPNLQRLANMNGTTCPVGRNQGTKQVSSSSISAESSLSVGTTTTTTSFSSLTRSDGSDTNISSRKSSDEVATSVASRPSFSSTWSHSTFETTSKRASNDSATLDLTSRKIDSIIEEPEKSAQRPHQQLTKSLSNPRRKTSTVIQPMSRSRGDSTGSESESRFIPHSWHTSIIDNNTIIAQYGNSSHDLIWWDPSFKIDFRLSSSVGLLSGTVTGIDPSKPEVTLKVFNNSPKQIGFSIRSHRQTTIFSSHVVYPTKGLQLLEPYKSWEDNVEFHSNNPAALEMFVIDVFFCTLDSKPTWNVVRKYAIMKAQRSKSPNEQLRRVSKRRMSHLQLPGTKDQKSLNLELVLSHGLQCVVKGKLEEAEIIFSQALYMPDFQRVPLKAFVYICLAVTANKKLKQSGYVGGLTPVIKSVEASSKLLSICEQGPGTVKMPYTIQLVKQLRKELNIEKLMKDFMNKKVGNKRASSKVEEQCIEEFKDISLEGKQLTFMGKKVVIPPNALCHPTNISLSVADSKHLIPMLKASGWEKVVQVATAIHIECNPPLDRFNKSIQITTTIPKEMKPGLNSMVRLMHSSYLRHWEDITDDIFSKVTVDGQEVHLETNLPGWLAISVIQFDPSMIAQMVLKSITIEPILLRLSVFGFMDPERKSIQLALYVVPCKSNEEPINREIEKPGHFTPMSFPHVIQAYPNERLQLAIMGSFELDSTLSSEEDSLAFELDAQSKHNQIFTRWVKSTLSSDLPITGKIKVSTRRNNMGSWDRISDISLSMRSTVPSSSGSASEQ